MYYELPLKLTNSKKIKGKKLKQKLKQKKIEDVVSHRLNSGLISIAEKVNDTTDIISGELINIKASAKVISMTSFPIVIDD